MLSKKMAVSLTSLITILALAFVAPTAMAVDFKVEIDGPRLVTYAAGAEGTAINIDLTVTSEEALLEPLTLATDANNDGDFADAGDTATANITVTTRDIRGFVKTVVTSTSTNLPATLTNSVTVVDDPVGNFADRTVKLRQLSVGITPGAAPSTLERVVITIPAFETPDTRVGDDHDMSIAVTHTILIRETGDVTADADDAKVVSIQRLRPGSQATVAAFQDEEISPDPFNVRIVLTEARFSRIDFADKTPDKLADELLKVEGGKATNLIKGVPFTQLRVTDAEADTIYRPHPGEGRYTHAVDTVASGLASVPPGLPPLINVPDPTGLDDMYHEYRVTITPERRAGAYTLKMNVKGFGSYAPAYIGEKPNGREQLRIPVKKDPRDLTSGIRVIVPKDIYIPAQGYLIIAADDGVATTTAAGTEVIIPHGRRDRAPRAIDRRPAQMLYNVFETTALPNLAAQFYSGVVIDVESSNTLLISEVMWGEDVSLTPSTQSQWIELYNPGSGFKTPDDKADTYDVDERLTLVLYRPNEFSDVPAKVAVAATATTPATMALPGRVTDRVGTLDAEGKYWSPVGIGQSGRSGTGEATADRGTFVSVEEIISMYRVMETDGTIDAGKGQMKASWKSSAGPKSANFDPAALGTRHGTPGAPTDATDTPADVAADTKAKEDKAKADADKIANTGTWPTVGQGRVYISEIMFAGGGTLPQWIEIANGDRSTDFNLSGWTLTVENAADDADVDVGSIKLTIPNGTTIDRSAQHDTPSTILIVTEKGRNSFDLQGAKASGQVIVLDEDGSTTQVDLINAGILKGKYTLLSDIGFMITLAPPVPAATKAPAGETATAKAARIAKERTEAAERKAAIDTAGNLVKGAATWALPMTEEGGRSSIIRKHKDIARGPAAPEDGMMEGNWTLAKDTAFADVTHIRAQSYYGAANDIGTPGFRAGGALPVELSHFRPARDKATGQVVITWATQSELNNAGFFIKRSQQRNGEFKVINATMIAGAGTTSEKQFYTYTDTTAQPNVVYYYQIEDVSLDGNRQTLTRGIRLKGHVGAAGKATTLWGELKASHE